MDIKKPLQGIDAAAAAGWKPEDRVIILGGGVAGLSAAYTLEYLKVPYTLLEASSQHGGRVKRNEEFLGNGTALDIGAEWIHTDPSVLKDLLLVSDDLEQIDQYIQKETIEFQPQTYGYYTFGRLWRMDFLKHTYKEHKFKRLSWSQYIDYFMVRHLKKENIEYNAIVQEIDYSMDDEVKVTCQNGKEYVASKVICAVPLSILKDGDIKFKPELPLPKKTALEKTEMKPGFKLAIEFKERFFVDYACDQNYVQAMYNMGAGLGAERLFFDALFGKEIDDRNVIGVYCYSTLATELAKLDDDALFSAIMKTLDKMYDGKATENYVQHFVQNWTQESFIRGAASSLWYRDTMEQEFGQRPLGDKVFFAGEHTAGYLSIAVHGASLSGRRAAMQCIGEDYKF